MRGAFGRWLGRVIVVLVASAFASGASLGSDKAGWDEAFSRRRLSSNMNPGWVGAALARAVLCQACHHPCEPYQATAASIAWRSTASRCLTDARNHRPTARRTRPAARSTIAASNRGRAACRPWTVAPPGLRDPALSAHEDPQPATSAAAPRSSPRAWFPPTA